MMHHKKTRTYIAMIASLAWILPSQAMAGAAAPVETRDVQLAAGGELQGQIVTALGTGSPDQLVVIRRQGVEVAQARTDAEGRFQIENLQGGLYEIATEHTSSPYRLWAPRTAPPAATNAVRLVSAPTVYRGQSGPPLGGFPVPVVVVGVGLAIAAAIAIPIVIAAQDDDSKAS